MDNRHARSMGLLVTADWLRDIARDIDNGEIGLDEIKEQLQSWVKEDKLRRTFPEFKEQLDA